MPNVLVRDVDVSILNKLKRRAVKRGRSLQAEVQIILAEAANRNDPASERELARKIRKSIGTKQTDSAVLLREDRER